MFLPEKRVLVAVINAARKTLPARGSGAPRRDSHSPLSKLALAPQPRARGARAFPAVRDEAAGRAALSK